jgi:S-adenosylmethionine:tRNA ribosyltransferase-isomerase
MNDRDLDLLQEWHYELPPELIASRPPQRREDARLMVLNRSQGSIAHHTIRDIPQLLAAHDVLVFNNTRVLPARLYGVRSATGGKWEGLFVSENSSGHWTILCETRGRLQVGESIDVIPAPTVQPFTPVEPLSTPRTLRLTLREKLADGAWNAELSVAGSPEQILNEFGSLPLPPYMGRRIADDDDRQRYQTVFASEPGAIAAPTAGLHFTPELLTECRSHGISSTELTLHVGIGTFRPVTVARLSEHSMHEEWCCVPESASLEIQKAKNHGGRVIAVGTTCVRTLESAAVQHEGRIQPWQGRTNIFIRPGFRFQSIDCLLTNFHLPGSTLLALTAAFAGYDLVMEAYRQAVSDRYRFFSYGDAMLIV